MMNITHYSSRPGGVLPDIYIQDSGAADSFRHSSKSSPRGSSSAISATEPRAVPIPHVRQPVPPPLPPPRHVDEPDIAWHWGNSHDNGWADVSHTVAPGSSLHGRPSYSIQQSLKSNQTDGSRRSSSTSTLKSVVEREESSYVQSDESYGNLLAISVGSHRSMHAHTSPSRRPSFQSSVHDHFQSTIQAYDKSLLQKLDSGRSSDNKTPPQSHEYSPLSASMIENSPHSRTSLDQRYPLQLKPLSLPIITSRASLTESPLAYWAALETPLSSTSSAISLGNPYSRFGNSSQMDHRSPSDAADTDSVATRESYGQRTLPDHFAELHMDEAGLRRLHLDEPALRSEGSHGIVTMVGQKRRASSPLGEDDAMSAVVGPQSDAFRRRESASRGWSGPRVLSTSGSMSSSASYPRSNSYVSTLSITTSSITSMNSLGRQSPGGLSPVPTDDNGSPYNASTSLNPSPRDSISRMNQDRLVSETRPPTTPRKLSENVNLPKVPKVNTHGSYICECCPKKPKKFDSQKELSAHEQEKQYECAYCKNRFKNKNEAERHQNSLHLRRHSWSCASLSGYAAAFYDSPTRPNVADSCGYCGEDFQRSGISPPTPSGHKVPIVTEQDWEARVLHLQEMHKFGECNPAKKFFRADHFRQHLKHSHAGTSGKWTNMLENACVKDEPLPEPLRAAERPSPGEPSVSRISEEDEVA